MIGDLDVDLTPLLIHNENRYEGWLPIYDTLRGMQGQPMNRSDRQGGRPGPATLYVIASLWSRYGLLVSLWLQCTAGQIFLVVKLEFVEELNPFRESSVGVQFFSISAPPQQHIHRVEQILGFVVSPAFHSLADRQADRQAGRRAMCSAKKACV